MIHAHRHLLPALAALALTACGDAASRPNVTQYWAQPDTVILGLGHPSDVKAESRDRVWVADRESAIILGIAPLDSQYVSIGRADLEPKQVQLPGKLAVSTDIGLSAYDIETGSVDLFTFGGDFIRGFEPGFVPAVMSFSKAPIGYTFAVAAVDSSLKRPVVNDTTGADSTFVRHAVIIHTDLQGGSRDTLLSPTRGPEALRGATAGPGETLMSPSVSGMWVWTRLVPDTVFDVSPNGVRRLALRADEAPLGLFADPERQMLWIMQADTSAVHLSAYDTRLATESGEGTAFLGERTIEDRFRPATVFDGVVAGFRPVLNSIAMTAYDLHPERFVRPEAP
jgi:hypothetical protein